MAVRQYSSVIVVAAALSAAPSAWADDMPGMEMPDSHHDNDQRKQTPASSDQDMQGMGNMQGMENTQGMQGMPSTGLLGSYPMTRDASGTSWQPDASTHGGLHAMWGGWSLMGHVRLTGFWDSQSGPRGDDGVYLSGMLMGAGRRDFANGDTLNLRVMLSPDPFAGKRGYPLLLQTGETADGTTPLTDRQHPHDLFMELAGSYSHKLSTDDSLFLYAGYPGEPALGPPAFMHRPSAIVMPSAPLSHHWLDSTHITFGVITGGFVHDDFKLEVSRFTGREPDQHRFDFDRATFDSTATRLSWNPDSHLALQVSVGFLNSPEQLEPGHNEIRYTASAIYVLPLGDDSSWSAMIAFGRKHLTGGVTLDSWLLESEYKPDEVWTIYARAESVRTDELFAGGGVKSVGEFCLGGIHDWRVAEHAKFGLGAQYTFDFTPSLPSSGYGSDPHGAMAFVRLNFE